MWRRVLPPRSLALTRHIHFHPSIPAHPIPHHVRYYSSFIKGGDDKDTISLTTSKSDNNDPDLQNEHSGPFATKTSTSTSTSTSSTSASTSTSSDSSKLDTSPVTISVTTSTEPSRHSYLTSNAIASTSSSLATTIKQESHTTDTSKSGTISSLATTPEASTSSMEGEKKEAAAAAPTTTSAPSSSSSTSTSGSGSGSSPPPTPPTINITLPSSSLSTIIRGVLWFDNMYPMRAHKLDPRFAFVQHNHERVVPKIMELIQRKPRAVLEAERKAAEEKAKQMQDQQSQNENDTTKFNAMNMKNTAHHHSHHSFISSLWPDPTASSSTSTSTSSSTSTSTSTPMSRVMNDAYADHSWVWNTASSTSSSSSTSASSTSSSTSTSTSSSTSTSTSSSTSTSTALSTSVSPPPAQTIKVLEIKPRPNEGGVFVRFQTHPTAQWKDSQQVANTIIRRLKAEPIHAFLTPQPVHCHLVKGEPFLEDLASRYPSTTLRIELKGTPTALNELTVEELYAELRQFGRIYDISLGPPVKEGFRTGRVQFARMFGAVGARNCLHRARLPSPVDKAGITLFFTYEQYLKTSVITDFFVKHPRIMVPLLGLLFAGFTILIFDPIREFNIVNHITGRFKYENIMKRLGIRSLLEKSESVKTKLMEAIKQKKADISSTPKPPVSWSTRQHDEDRVDKFLKAPPTHLLFVTGSKGTGKEALIQKVIATRPNVITMDVGHLMDRTDDEFVKGLSACVGFAPGFAFMTYMANIMDVLTPGASKAATSSAKEAADIAKVLEVTTNALTTIQRKQLKQEKKRMEQALKVATSMSSAAATNAEHAAQHSDKSDSHTVPIPTNAPAPTVPIAQDAIPLFVVNGFSEENKDKHSKFMSTFLSWATEMTNAKLAHVILLTDNALYENITKTMPDMRTTNIVLSDASLESAIEFVENSIGVYAQQQQAEQEQAHADTTLQQPKPAPIEAPTTTPKTSVPTPDPSSSTSSKSFVLPSAITSPLTSIASKLSNHNDTTPKQAPPSTSTGLSIPPLDTSTLTPSQTENLRQELQSEEQKEEQRVKHVWHLDDKTIKAIGILGGRYSDLYTLVRSIEGGQSPVEAVEEIVAQSMNNVRSVLFGDPKAPFNRVQLWQVMLLLSAAPAGDVLYDDVLFNVFVGDDAALRALVRADLLRVTQRPGTDDVLSAGSPVYLEAFRRLCAQPKLRPGMDLMVVKYYLGQEQNKCNTYEEELVRLQQIEDQLRTRHRTYIGSHDVYDDSHTQRNGLHELHALQTRKEFLLKLLNESHAKIMTWDEKRRACEAAIKKIKNDVNVTSAPVQNEIKAQQSRPDPIQNPPLVKKQG